MDTIQYERNLLSAEVVFRKVTPMDCELSYALSFMSAQDLRGKRYGKLEATGKMKKGIVKKKSTQDKVMMRKYRFAVSSVAARLRYLGGYLDLPPHDLPQPPTSIKNCRNQLKVLFRISRHAGLAGNVPTVP